MLSTGAAIAAIAVMAIVTFLTRVLPFLLFDRGESPPKLVLYLGRVLPPAIIAMLIVYCLRGVSFSTPGGWVPQLLCVAVVVALHLWKHNNLLSIFGGTVLYMVLVQAVFGNGRINAETQTQMGLCLCFLKEERKERGLWSSLTTLLSYPIPVNPF